MNVAQIGKSTLGDKLAALVTKLSDHSFILDKCGFSAINKTKGVTERSVGEALGLVSFGIDGWIKGYKELCLKMSECIEESDVEWFNTLLDKLDAATVPTVELKNHMVNKEFFIVLANFDYFMGKGYKLECYGKFLQYFVSDLKYQNVINTDELDEDGNEIFDSYVSIYEKSTKNKNVIESRLNQMNDMLDKYLAENCADMTEEDIECEDEAEQEGNTAISGFVDEFISTKIPHNTKETAIKALIAFTSYPVRDFTQGGVEKFKAWIAENPVSEDCIEDCLLSAYNLKDYLNNAGATDKFSENDIAILVHCVYTKFDDVDETLFEEWLKSFVNDNQCEKDGDNQSLLEKETLMVGKFNEFVNERME